MRRMLRAARELMTAVLAVFVRGYQLFISPWMPMACRFRPTCSEYMLRAIRKKGPVRGLLLGIYRVLRCNPLCEGGYDPVE